MALLILFLLGGTARGEPYTVTVDISSIAGSEFLLEFWVYDIDHFIGNTSLWIDNVFISDAGGVITPPGVIDFESGGYEGFVPDPLDPSVANIISGGFAAGAGGSYLLELTESSLVNPTLTCRGFDSSSATTLQFDYELVTTSAGDSMVASIIDPDTGRGFDTIPDLTGLGLGDVLETVGGSPPTVVDGVSVQIIPAPGAFLLGCIGLAFANWKLRKRKKL